MPGSELADGRPELRNLRKLNEPALPDLWRGTLVAEGENKKAASGQKRRSVTRVGDFELKKKLGKGGMGEVFLARQISLDRWVALKTLSKDLAKKEDFVARFLREARAMAKLDHNNAVKVYAVDSFKGVHFAAIEYVDGASVQDWLDKLKVFPIGDAVHIAMVSAEALRHAHDQNMVHRDIKPDNILLTAKGVVKVADFGLAKVLDDDVSMTQSGTGLGTPLYMPPEQARSAKTVDQRSDVYALGATLYHMLTGKLPFSGGTALELIMAKETGTYESARKVRPEIPERLDLIIDKMMAKDAAHRYANCEDLLRDLAGLGIHSEAISFVDGAQVTGAGPARSSTVVSAGKTMVAGSRSNGRVSSKVDAKRSAKKAASRTWYVQYTQPNGKLTVEKHTTGRIVKMLKAGTLTAKAKAKASAGGAYLPVAKFPEFAEIVEDQLSQHTASLRKKDMSKLYQQVERDQRRLIRWRWLTRRFRGFVGMISLIIWLVIVIGLLWLLFTYGLEVFRYLGDRVTEMMNPAAQPE